MDILNPENIKLTQDVSDYIKHNNGKTVTAPELAERFHAHPSKIRGCVSLGRSMGFPICSNARGYYWSENPVDIKQTIDHIEDRINKQQNAVKGMKEWLANDKG